MGAFCTKKQTEYELDDLSTGVRRNPPYSRDCVNNMQNLNSNELIGVSNNDQVEENRRSAVKTKKAISNQMNKKRHTSARSSTEGKSIPHANVHDDGRKSGTSPEYHSLDSSDNEDAWDLNKKIAGSHSLSEPVSNLNTDEHDNKEIHTFEKRTRKDDDSLYEVNKTNTGTDTKTRSHSPSKPVSYLHVRENDNKGIHNSEEKTRNDGDTLYGKNKNNAGTETTTGSHSSSDLVFNINVVKTENKGLHTLHKGTGNEDDELYRVNKNNRGTDTTRSIMEDKTHCNKDGRQSPSKPVSNLQEGGKDNKGKHTLRERTRNDGDTLYGVKKNNTGTDTTTDSVSLSTPVPIQNVSENEKKEINTLHKKTRNDDGSLFAENTTSAETGRNGRTNNQISSDCNKADSVSLPTPVSIQNVRENEKKEIHTLHNKTRNDDGSLIAGNKACAQTGRNGRTNNQISSDCNKADSVSLSTPVSIQNVSENEKKEIHTLHNKTRNDDGSLIAGNKACAETGRNGRTNNQISSDCNKADSVSLSTPVSIQNVSENEKKEIYTLHNKTRNDDGSLIAGNKACAETGRNGRTNNQILSDCNKADSVSLSTPVPIQNVSENEKKEIHTLHNKTRNDDGSLIAENNACGKTGRNGKTINQISSDCNKADSASLSTPVPIQNVSENEKKEIHTLHDKTRNDDGSLIAGNKACAETGKNGRTNNQISSDCNKADTQPATKPASDTIVNKHEREDVDIIDGRTKTGDGTSFAMTKDMAETVDQRLRNHTGLRIVLIGKTGSGKSCTGNTILGRDAFMSSDSANSVTSECRSEKSKINGRIVTVVDTPGIFDTRHTDDEIQTEIARCICMVMPGPDAIILVVPFGRFTDETHESFDYFCKHFGEDMFKYLIILFTKSEDLKHKKQTLDDYVHNSTRLMCFAKKCGDRYIRFSNTASERNKGKQVLNLLTQIDSMVHKNGGTCYTNAMFKKVQDCILMDISKETEEKEKEYERQVRLIERDLSEKYQMVIEQHEKRIALLEREDLTTIHNIEKMKKELEDRTKHEMSELTFQKNIQIKDLDTQRAQESGKILQFGNIKKRCMNYVQSVKRYFKGSTVNEHLYDYNESHIY